MRKILTLTALAGLAACSSTPSLSPTLQPASSVLGNTNITGIVPSGTNPTITITDVNGNVISGISKDAGLTSTSYGAATKTGANPNFDVIAFSDDGLASQGQTSYVQATTIGVATGAGAGQVSRYSRVASVLPTSGSGTFSGQYRGTIVNTATGQSIGGAGVAGILGTANLNVNFPNQTIGGTITSRSLQQPGSNTPNAFSTVNLAQTTFGNAGTYNGTATGGAYNTGTTSTSGGTYEGLIGGTNGLWTAGALQLTHTVNGTNYNELGVFTGKR